jgi:hypothetical protein
MANLWEQIRALDGRSMATSTGRGTFDGIEVDEHRIRIMLHRERMTRRSIERWRFERAEALGLARSDVIPDEIRKSQVSEFDPAYVAAIIRAAIDQVRPK